MVVFRHALALDATTLGDDVAGHLGLDAVAVRGRVLAAVPTARATAASTHPRTRHRMAQYGVEAGNGVSFPDPFGLFDFITLEKNAKCVLSDSGTVQEECAVFKVPNVTLRDVTERPETIECGSNVLSGADPDTIANCVRTVLSLEPKWNAPAEYTAPAVSDTVVRMVTGYYHSLR